MPKFRGFDRFRSRLPIRIAEGGSPTLSLSIVNPWRYPIIA
jgi:hypothetical protein